MFNTKVSFIIPSYNSGRTIHRTLESIFSQNAFYSVKDVIVVDSSDDQTTREYLQTVQRTNFKLILLDQKTPPAQGRNRGAKEASGEVLCFIDSDVYLDRVWLSEVLNAYESGCRVGGGAIAVPEFQQNNILALAQLYLQFNEYLSGNTLAVRNFVPSCNLFCKREIFEKVGGFPEIRASEDTLFCLRLKNLAAVWFVPAARCFHVFREEWQSFIRNQELLGKYVLVYRRTYYKGWMYKSIMPIILLPAFLVIKVARMKLRIYKAGQPHAQRFLQSFFAFMAGIFYWGVGFAKGSLEKNETAQYSIS